MANLYWLKTIQPCKLELRPLTDYAGQPLIFTTPGTGFSRRCVTEEVRNSETVQLYIKRQMIAEESVVNTQPTLARVTASPVASKPVPPPAPPAAPPSMPPPAPPPAPVVIEVTDQVQVIETLEEPTAETGDETAAETLAPATDDNSDTRRNKRGRNR